MHLRELTRCLLVLTVIAGCRAADAPSRPGPTDSHPVQLAASPASSSVAEADTAGLVDTASVLPSPLVRAACDSAAAMARRGFPTARPGMLVQFHDTMSMDYPIEGAGTHGCGVTIRGATADGHPGGPEYAFTEGMGGPGWGMSGRFMADGPLGTSFAVTRPGVLCKVDVGWYDPGDYPDDSLIPPDPPGADSFTVAVQCVPDRGKPPPPPEIPFFQFERSYSLNVNHGHPCTHLSQYTIVATPLGDGQNYDLIIRPFPEGHCDIDSAAGDLVVRHVTAGEVSGVQGDAFVTDVRPATDGRILRIIDLPSQRTLFEGRYLEIDDRAPPGKIGLWQRVALPTPKPWCPEPVIGAPKSSADSLRYVDLKTGEITPGHWETCPVHPRERR